MRSPLCPSGIRRSRYREPCVHVLVQIKSPNPECRWSTSQHSRSFRGFPYREIGTSDVAVHMYHEFPNPELRCHLSSTRAWGPTLPRPLRDFADRGSMIQVSSWSKTPKRRMPKPRSLTSRDRAPPVLVLINNSRLFGKLQLAISMSTTLLPCQMSKPDMLISDGRFPSGPLG